MVVFTEADCEYRAVAETIAESRGDDVVSTLDGIGRDDVIYVDSPENVDEGVLLDLQRRQCRSEGTANFGIITGYRPELAEGLYFREKAPRDDHYVVNNRISIPYATDDSLTVLPNDEDGDTVSRLQTETMESLGLTTGGHSMHYYLPNGFICGFPDSIDVERYGDRQPACVAGGERDCPLDGELVLAEDIDASHVFVSSCASIIQNNSIDLPVHVGMGLLTQVESLIGTYRILSSFPHETFLYQALLRDGYDLGEVCYVLNRYSDSLSNEIYPYFLYGRPENRSASAREGAYRTSVEPSDSGIAVTITDIDCHVVDLSVPKGHLGGDESDVTVDVRGDERDIPFYHCVFEEQDAFRVLVYSGGRMSADRLELRVEQEATYMREKDAIFACARNLRKHEGLGLLNQKMKNQLTHVENNVHTLSSVLERARLQSEARPELRDKLSEMDAIVDGIYDELHETLTDANGLLYEYLDRVVRDGSYVSNADCSDCGNTVFVSEVVEPLTSVKRAIGTCPECGYLFDAPATDNERFPPSPSVTSLEPRNNSERTFTVEFDNPTSRFAKGISFPSLVGVGYEEATDRGLFYPASHRFTLRVGETYTNRFTVDVSGLPPNEYYLFVYVVLNGEIFVSECNFTVGGANGRIPEYLLE